MKPAKQSEKPPFELIEEAFHLVRLAPMSALAAYYLGSLPFVLVLLFFWSDMSRSAYAEQRFIPGVLGLTGLFVWMKAWQSHYCRQLLAQLCGEPAPRWTLRSFLHTATYQAIVQPAGLFLLPITLLFMVPFGWTYAFFTSATVIHGIGNPSLRAALARSWRQMTLWPMQNHTVITLFVLFGVFVFANLFTALLGVPFLMKTLLGIESVFTRSPWAAMNGTLLAAQIALTYLCLDPVVKAAFVLRCFYGESLRTAQDLRAEFRLFRSFRAVARGKALLAALVVVTSTLCLAQGAEPPASPPAVPAEKMDNTIERTIQKREYSWRLPPEPGKKEKGDADSFTARLARQIENGFKALGRWVEDLVKWISAKLRFPGSASLGTGITFGSVMGVAVILLLAALLGTIIWLLLRLWLNREPSEEVVAEAVPSAPDLNQENVSADELPDEGWVQLARDLLGRGELRLALRAFYLASLSHLGQRNLVTLARCKSNREYERELLRRAHVLANIPQLFSDSMNVFERVWYGSHDVTPDMLNQVEGNLAQMKATA
jgi:Domain of unknown function (DUF4129)